MTHSDTLTEEAEEFRLYQERRYALAKDILLRFLGIGVAYSEDALSVQVDVKNDQLIHAQVDDIAPEAVKLADALLKELGLSPPLSRD